MVRAAAFCPHPPLLVPQVAQGAAAELDELRDACRTAIRRVADLAAQLIVVGAGPASQEFDATARGTLAGYGVPAEISLGSDEPGPVALPLSLTIGAWLLRDALGPNCGAIGYAVGVGSDQPPPHIDAAVGLVVMADGSARRSTSAPGYLDDRAAGYDAGVANALRTGNPRQLSPDPRLAAELLVDGIAAWEFAARVLDGRTWEADLLYAAAPYGVGYFVATWT